MTLQDSTIHGFRKHKNFIWEQAHPEVYMFTGYRVPETASEQEKLAKNKYVEYKDRVTPDESVLKGFAYQKYKISQKSNLVVPIHEYKLISEDDKTEFLDFSRNNNQYCNKTPTGKPECFWFGLIPDYDRKTHVLAAQLIDRFEIKEKNTNYTSFVFDPNDTRNNRKGTPIKPFILSEIVHTEERRVNVD